MTGREIGGFLGRESNPTACGALPRRHATSYCCGEFKNQPGAREKPIVLFRTILMFVLFLLKRVNRMRWACLAWVGVPRSSEVSEVVDEVQAVVVLHLASGAQVGEQLQSLSTDLILSFCRHCPPASFWLGSSTQTYPLPPTPHKHLTQVTL